MQRISPAQRQPLFNVAATRQIEQAAAAALPGHALMQRAGLAVARLALALAPHASRIWIACGPGNNGGDGLEAAMHLQRWGKAPHVSWLGDEGKAPPDALASLQRAREAGVAIVSDAPAHWELAIDALLGIGGAREPQARMAEWIARMNAAPAPVLAVDLPSGLNADTGTGMAVRASHTLSLLTLKPGLFTATGRDAAGEIWHDGLDVPIDAAAVAPTALLSSPAPPLRRLHASHKGSYGDVAVIGGGPGMGGAALLAGSAALHGGAGRVFVCLLDAAAMTVDCAQPELMLRAWNSLDLAAMAVACGCGGGDTIRSVLPAVLSTARALVLDADALNAIAADPQLQSQLTARAARSGRATVIMPAVLSTARAPSVATAVADPQQSRSARRHRAPARAARSGRATVITPHPLEAARLLGRGTADVQANRLAAANELARRFSCVAVLKGSGTVTAAPGELPVINFTGNARLATAGTGDVLAGMIAARLAQGIPAFAAAHEAVHAHGACADHWPDGLPLTASELARRA
jgi:hydroxyethylthiazole kinase-like uncharacterized protein yjeF